MKKAAHFANSAWLAIATLCLLNIPISRATPPAPQSWSFKPPILFETNQGQAPDSVGFVTRIGLGSMLLSPTSSILYAPTDPRQEAPATARPIQIHLVGANPHARLEGVGGPATQIHFLNGSDPQSWHNRIAAYTRIKAASIYPGIDLVHYGQGGQIEYDFNLAPGGDPQSIRLDFTGIDRLEVDSEGNLLVKTDSLVMRHHRPVAYQIRQGARCGIPVQYTLIATPPASNGAPAHWTVGFEVGAYDSTEPLTIDPVLSFASYLGGNGDDQAYGVAIDSAGCVYVAGQTASSDFAATKTITAKTNGLYDVFVTKYSADGRQTLYSTIIGGTGNDRGFSIAVDSAGCAIVVGETTSTNFPVKKAFHPFFIGGDHDAFLFKLAADGADFVFSTYVGGTGSDDLTCVAVDRADNIVAGGATSSTNFPVVKPFQAENQGGFDAVLVKFATDGILKYSSYLGGSGPYDSAIGIAVDQEQCVYLTGYSSSSDFPLLNPLQSAHFEGYDAFVTKFNPSGSGLVYSTLLGGNADDVGRGIAVDSKGNACIAGDTYSTNFPIVRAWQPKNGGKRDVFVSKISPSGLTLLYSSFFGGSGEELASLAIDPAGAIWLVGLTTSTNLPLANPIQNSFGGGIWDAFVARFSPAGDKLAFSTYLGGSGNDQGAAIAIDPSGSAYVVGASTSTNFTTVKPLQAANRGGLYDAFVLRISEPGPAPTNAVTKLITAPVAETATSIVVAATPPSLKPAAAAPTTTNPATQAPPEPVKPTPTNAPPTAPKTTELPAPKTLPAEPAANRLAPATNPLTASLPVSKSAVNEPATNGLAIAKETPVAKASVKATIPTATPANAPAGEPEEDPMEQLQLAAAPLPATWPKSKPLAAAIQPISTAPIDPNEGTAPTTTAADDANPKETGESKPETTASAPPQTPIDAKWLRHPLVNTNLIVDSGAEAATPSASSYQVTPPPGWKVISNLTVLRYGTIGGFPATNSVPEGGKNFFAGGPESELSTGTQTTNVSELAQPIDANQLQCAVAGYFGSMSSQKDNSILQAVFLNAEGKELGQVSTVPVLPAERGFKTQMLPRSATAPIPPQTRIIEIRLIMKRVDGTYNDAYADNLSLTISAR
jgi:hypothetical protein